MSVSFKKKKKSSQLAVSPTLFQMASKKTMDTDQVFGLLSFNRIDRPLEPKGILVAVWPEIPGHRQVSAYLAGLHLCPALQLANLIFPPFPRALIRQGVGEPSPPSAFSGMSLGMSINSLHLSSLGCKRIRPASTSLQSPPAG